MGEKCPITILDKLSILNYYIKKNIDHTDTQQGKILKEYKTKKKRGN